MISNPDWTVLMPLNRLTKNQLLQIQQASVSISGSSDEWPILKEAIEIITEEPLEKRSARWLREFSKNYLKKQNEGQTDYIISPIASESSDHPTLPVSGEVSL
jgi:hypothetical protein